MGYTSARYVPITFTPQIIPAQQHIKKLGIAQLKALPL